MRSPPGLNPVTWMFLAKPSESQKQTNDNHKTNKQANKTITTKTVMNVEGGLVGADKRGREIGRHVIIRMQVIRVQNCQKSKLQFFLRGF